MGLSVGPPQLRPDFSGCHPAFQIKLLIASIIAHPLPCLDYPVSTIHSPDDSHLPPSPHSLTHYHHLLLLLLLALSTIFQYPNNHQHPCAQSSYFIDHITPGCLLWLSSCETGHNLALSAGRCGQCLCASNCFTHRSLLSVCIHNFHSCDAHTIPTLRSLYLSTTHSYPTSR